MNLQKDMHNIANQLKKSALLFFAPIFIAVKAGTDAVFLLEQTAEMALIAKIKLMRYLRQRNILGIKEYTGFLKPAVHIKFVRSGSFCTLEHAGEVILAHPELLGDIIQSQAG